MRKLLVVLGFLTLFGATAQAQTPRVELFTGFSYGQFDPGGKVTFGIQGTGRHFAMPGLEATGQFNLSRSFGVVADVSGYGGTAELSQFPEHLRYYNILFGPQITARDLGPFNIFVRGLVGSSNARISYVHTDPNTGANLGTTRVTQTKLTYGLGGGIDLNASKHIALRLIQIDYLRGAYDNCTPASASAQVSCVPVSSNQNNFRVAAGFNWRF